MKLKVTDRAVYRTIVWTIEDEEPLYGTADIFTVTCQENDYGETWSIVSDLEGDIDVNSELGDEIKNVCEVYEDFDMDGGYGG